MRIAICILCEKDRAGYPAGPRKEHYCSRCRRILIKQYGISDPWVMTADPCDACDGIGWGKMKMTDGWRSTPCPVCDGDIIDFKLKNPLMLLAECADEIQPTETATTPEAN